MITRNILPIIFFVSFSISLWAQTEKCGTIPTDELIASQKNLSAEEKEVLLENFRTQSGKTFAVANSKQPKGNLKADETLIVPVVFHVIHNYGSENISSKKIRDYIHVLNEDFNKMHPNLGEVYPEFSDIVADCNIEFRLASRDPEGNCTDGITRHAVKSAYFFSQQEIEPLKREIHWPTENYLNIYLVGSISRNGASVTLGYAYLPWWPGPGDYRDGFVAIYSGIGHRGISSGTGTHEIGHYLGLPHTFGRGTAGSQQNCSDAQGDNIDDTPQTTGHPSRCPSKVSSSTCGTLDNIRNFMDYSACEANFTIGQKTVMRDVLKTVRNNLISNNNLVLTGANYSMDSPPTELCKADFSVNIAEPLCRGNEFTFSDLSFHSVDTWQWTFPGGTPATSTEENPTILYNEAGNFDVSLTVSNGTNTMTVTKEKLIQILPDGFFGDTLKEGFEDIDLNATEKITVLNPDEDPHQWKITDKAAKTGEKSIFLNVRRTEYGNIDEFITNTVDLTGINDAILSFDYAFAPRKDNSADELSVYISRDCGSVWTREIKLFGSLLRTAPNQVSGDFIPTKDQWKSTSTELFKTSTGTRVKFSMQTGSGNNLYIDNINLISESRVLGIDKHTGLISTVDAINIFPNPVSDMASIVLETSTATNNANIEIYDLIGNKVKSLSHRHFSKGQHTISVDLSEVKPGVYFVKVTKQKMTLTKRFVVK